MTAAARPAPRDRTVPLAMAALPVLGTAYQVAATMTARTGARAADTFGWIGAAAATPWPWLLLACEAASFLLWTAVLARMPLSRAFPISAVGYVLVVAVAAVGLGEPLRPATVVGSVAILAGAALLATDAA